MTPDALSLELPDLCEDSNLSRAEVANRLSVIRQCRPEDGLQLLLELLISLNRSQLTLLERQRLLQNLCDEYRRYMARLSEDTRHCHALLGLCGEMATGFKRLAQQVLQGRRPSVPHLAWCFYMALHFLARQLLLHYQCYQEPPASLWRDSHRLYWLGEQQQCLDEPVAAAFQPSPAGTLRGLYQQMLLLALSNPFHLAEGEISQLFAALAPHAALARLLPWDNGDEDDALLIDLTSDRAFLARAEAGGGETDAGTLRCFEPGALLVALGEPAPLQSQHEIQLLERVSRHWQGREQRRHERTESVSRCTLVAGLTEIHAHLLDSGPKTGEARILDASPGGARLLYTKDAGADLQIGQLVLLNGSSRFLGLICWRYQGQAGLHLGLRYLKGLPRPVWLRRAPAAQAHPGILQSTPEPGNGWHHGLWLPNDQFATGEALWLQMADHSAGTRLSLPESNLKTPTVTRHPLLLS
ncbi:PilZ domain-containing protein [Pseudomonas sp. NCCP-436]|uniref:PilZ domain-containing protein n=1 Tax=Pseudomonas sp. NCCP-436 TaxID=2842481 RepID=UPI001C8271EE|nr:PilZ domain-containing protein [Pseudomonas sp. NCCP-436]GIZ13235.1 hypothetical protein NCCP436_26510 [Pseudomonas sp. NCCP-436]